MLTHYHSAYSRDFDFAVAVTADDMLAVLFWLSKRTILFGINSSLLSHEERNK